MSSNSEIDSWLMKTALINEMNSKDEEWRICPHCGSKQEWYLQYCWTCKAKLRK